MHVCINDMVSRARCILQEGCDIGTTFELEFCERRYFLEDLEVLRNNIKMNVKN